MGERTKIYIDGFNLYHSIGELRGNTEHLKWLNLWSFSASLVRQQDDLVGVEYFSAFKRTNIDRLKRHEEYVKALEYYGVVTHMGKFKRKRQHCKKCHQTYTAWEEKETDVHLAVKIIEDSFTDQFSNAIIISADTDLLPPINSVKSFHPDKSIVVIAPPGRMSRCRSLSPIYEIRRPKLTNNLLPAEGFNGDGSLAFKRPAEYDPPP